MSRFLSPLTGSWRDCGSASGQSRSPPRTTRPKGPTRKSVPHAAGGRRGEEATPEGQGRPTPRRTSREAEPSPSKADLRAGRPDQGRVEKADTSRRRTGAKAEEGRSQEGRGQEGRAEGRPDRRGARRPSRRRTPTAATTAITAGRHRLDADCQRPRHAHGARPGPVLRRHGPPQERPRHDDAEHGRPGRRRRVLGRDRLRARVRPVGDQGRPVRRRGRRAHRLELGPVLPARASSRPRYLPGYDIPVYVARHVPGDVRDHHPGPDQRGDRRAHPVLAVLPLHAPVGHVRLLPAGPHGLGVRLVRHDACPPAKQGLAAIGLLGKMGALDFAGGTVVHIAAGFAGLACVPGARQAARLPEAWSRTRTAWC